MNDVTSAPASAVDNNDGATPEEMADVFEPLNAIAMLTALANEPRPSPLPSRLPLSEINLLPELFQPRGANGIVERHVQELKRSIKNQGELEPVVVTWFGPNAYLIDGHHRIAAYEQARHTAPIPVIAFEGTVKEAVLEAGKANSRAKLPMDTQGRQNFGWRLVMMGGYSKKEIRTASGISDGQVANMRRTAKLLGEEAYQYATWWRAQQAAKGMTSEPLSDDETEARLEALANDYADRMAKMFSTKLAQNPELAARAFAVYFGRKLPSLIHALRDHAADIVDDEDDDF